MTLYNGNEVFPQYNTMPTPTSTNMGTILQYVGTTNVNYTNGYWYKCVSDGAGGYEWVNTLVQDSYTKSEIGDLDDLPDNTKNVVQNITKINLDIDDLKGSLNNKENKFRFTTMPIATDYIGKIVQYIGDTTSSYTKGYFYESRSNKISIFNIKIINNIGYNK